MGIYVHQPLWRWFPIEWPSRMCAHVACPQNGHLYACLPRQVSPQKWNSSCRCRFGETPCPSVARQHLQTRISSREVRIRAPFSSVVYFSRGTLPTKKGQKGTLSLRDLAKVSSTISHSKTASALWLPLAWGSQKGHTHLAVMEVDFGR